MNFLVADIFIYLFGIIGASVLFFIINLFRLVLFKKPLPFKWFIKERTSVYGDGWVQALNAILGFTVCGIVAYLFLA